MPVITYPSPIVTGSSGGTVTSVGLTMPAIFTESGSPVTTSGTIAVGLQTQSANKVWAGPTTGSAATPTFRSLVAADVPANVSDLNTLTGSVTLAAGSNVTITPSGNTLTIAASGGGGGGSLNYFNGYMANTGTGWTTNSSTFLLPTGGDNTLTTRVSSGITVTAGASNQPGIAFMPASATSVYLISATFTGGVNAGSGEGFFQLSDGTNVISTAQLANGTTFPSVTLTGVYAPATTSAVEVDIYAATSGFSTSIATGQSPPGANSIEWSVVQIVP